MTLFPPKMGRPKHGLHSCEKCGKILESAYKKRDHQRRCRQHYIIIQPIMDIDPNPNLLELLKFSSVTFTTDSQGYDVVHLAYSQDEPRLTQ